MTDLDPEEEKLLASARRAWSPSEADAERVLKATTLALGVPAAALPTASPANVTTKGSSLAAVSSKWIAGALVVSGVAVGSYIYGYRAGRAATETAAREAAITAPLKNAPAEARESAPTASSSRHAPVPTPRPSAAPAIGTDATADAHPTLLAPLPAASNVATGASTAKAPSAPHTASLQAELRALQRAERELRDGHPEVALRLLAKLDREVPRGALLEERAAAWALARCGTSHSNDVAAEFVRQHPASVYAERVTAACAAEKRPEPR